MSMSHKLARQISPPKGTSMLQSERSPGRQIWRKSSYSITNGECIEVATSQREIKIRDSSHPASGIICASPTSWQRFISEVKQR